jgi:hypothetical protein
MGMTRMLKQSNQIQRRVHCSDLNADRLEAHGTGPATVRVTVEATSQTKGEQQ